MWRILTRLGCSLRAWNRCMHLWQLWLWWVILKDPWLGSTLTVLRFLSSLLGFWLLLEFPLFPDQHRASSGSVSQLVACLVIGRAPLLQLLPSGFVYVVVAEYALCMWVLSWAGCCLFLPAVFLSVNMSRLGATPFRDAFITSLVFSAFLQF